MAYKNYISKIVIYLIVACRRLHLHLRDLAADPGGDGARSQHVRHSQLPVQDQRSAQANPGEEMVHGAARHHSPRRNSALRIHLHRDVSPSRPWQVLILKCFYVT